jgi:ribonuclease P/MRP protein subunit RPP1
MSQGNILRSYDIAAVVPLSDKAFVAACTQLDIDIISIDMSQRLPYHLNQSAVKGAIKRGVMFEICYAHALTNIVSRRYLVHNGCNIVRLTGGKNIIVSSNAKDAMEIRGPYDVINLCSLFGMSKEAAAKSISTNCIDAIIHGERRKVIKGFQAVPIPVTTIDVDEMIPLGDGSDGEVESSNEEDMIAL